MTQYSWAGTAARKGHVQKSPFKVYARTLALFQELVKLSDPAYSTIDSEQFFKTTVLQHSARRNKVTVRASTSKRRLKANGNMLEAAPAMPMPTSSPSTSIVHLEIVPQGKLIFTMLPSCF